MALLKLENLGKRINRKWTLWDVNLEINPGEILGVFGRSESGKSMLGRIVAGIDEQTSGSISFRDPEIGTFIPSIALSTPAYAPEFSVYENLEMFACLWGIPGKKRANQISFLLELLKLSEHRDAKPGDLSTGTIKRMELARALLADSPLLIIDGLFDSMDQNILDKLWDYMLAMRRDENKSVMILTASNKIAEMCEKIAVMHRGSVGFVGRPNEFRRMAGEDMVVLGDVGSPLIKKNIQEQFALVVREEDGFLSFRVSNGERVIGDLLAEFGSELSCVYLKRPTLDDALDAMSADTYTVFAAADEPEVD